MLLAFIERIVAAVVLWILFLILYSIFSQYILWSSFIFLHSLCLHWYSLFLFLNSEHLHPFFMSVYCVQFVLMKDHGSQQHAICRRVVIVHLFCRQGTLFFTMLLFYSSIFGLTCFFFHSFHLISFWYKQSLKVHFILNDMSLSKGLSHFVAGPELQSKFLQGQVMLILKKGSSCEHVWFQLFSFFQPLISRQNLSALF